MTQRFDIGDRVQTPDGIGTIKETSHAPAYGVLRDNLPPECNPKNLEGYFPHELIKLDRASA